MGRMNAIIWLAALAFCPGVALAENPILTRGADCVPVMTIQKRGCLVETQYLCGTGDAATWRSEEFDMTGLPDIALSTPAHDPIEFAARSGEGGFVYDRARTSSTHPSAVIASGAGEFQQEGLIRYFGLSRPIVSLGTMKRLDPPLVLDGVTL